MPRMLGEAGVAIIPVSDGFRAKMEAQMRQAMAGAKAEIPVSANMRAAEAQLAKYATLAGQTKASVKVTADLGSAERDLGRFEAALKAMSHPKVKFDSDMTKIQRDSAVAMAYIDKLKEAARAGIKLNSDTGDTQAKFGVILTTLEKLQREAKNIKGDGDVAPIMSKIGTVWTAIKDVSQDARNIHMDADATKLKAEVAQGILMAKDLQRNLKDMAMSVDDAKVLRKFALSITEADVLGDKLRNLRMDGDATPLLLKLKAATIEANTLMDEMTRPREVKINPVIDMSQVLASLTREEALIQSLKSKMSMRADLRDANVQEFLVKTLSNTEMLREKLNTMRAKVEDAEAKIAVDDLTARVIGLQERMANLSPHASVSNILTDFATLESVVGKTADKYGVFKEEQRSVFADMAGFTGVVGRFGDRVSGAGRDATNSFNLMSGAVGGVLHAMGRVTLFGGMFNKLNSYLLSFVSGWHLLADVIFEVIAVWVPATIAFGAWAAAAAPDVQAVAKQFQNMGTAVAATGKQLNNFKGATKLFSDSMQQAVRPAVWTLVGEAIQVVNSRSDAFIGFLKQMNPLVQSLGARAAVALQHGFGNFLSGGAKMFYELGTAIGNFLGILGNLGRVVPHYAEILLGLGTAFLKIVEDITASPLFQAIVGFGLKLHGAAVYLGVLITLLATVGRSLLGGFLQGFAGARAKIQQFTAAEREAAAATGELDAATAAAGGNLKKTEGAVASAAMGMGGLGKATKTGETALKDAGAASEDTRGKMGKLGSGLGGLIGNMGNLGTKTKVAWKSLDEGASVASRMGGMMKKAGSGALGLVSSLTGLGPIGLTVVGVAAAIGGILYLNLRKTADATQQWINSLNDLATNGAIQDFTTRNTTNIRLMEQALNSARGQVIQMANSQNVLKTTGSGLSRTYNQASKSLQLYQQHQNLVIAGNVSQGAGLTQVNTAQQEAAAGANTLANAQRGSGAAANALMQQYNELQSAIGHAHQQQQLFSNNMKFVTSGIRATTGASLTSAQVMQMWTIAGLKTNDMLTNNKGLLSQDIVQVSGAIQGFQAMGTAVGGANTALNALNVTTSNTLSEVQKVTQAYTQFIGIVTGGAQAFAQFQQGQATLAQALAPPGSGGTGAGAGGGKGGTGTFTFANGKVSASQPVTGSGGVIGGVGQAGAAALAAYVQQIQQAEQVMTALETQAALAGNTPGANMASGKASKDLVAILGQVPGVKGNPGATSMLGALAQTGGFTGATTDFKGITQWAGNASNATGDLNKQMNLLTVSSSNLNQDAARLSNTMGTQLLQAESNAIMMAEGLGPKLQNLAKATMAWINAGANVGGKGWGQMMKTAAPVAALFQRQYKNTNLARQSLEAYLEQMGVSPKVATQMADALIKANAATRANTDNTKAGAAAYKATLSTVTASQGAWLKFAASMGVSSREASKLWRTLHQNGIRSLINDTAGSERAFERLAARFGITKGAADQLWGKFHQQSLDMLTTKAGMTWNQFNRLAREFGVVGAGAAHLWAQAHQQQFDMLGGKAHSTANQIHNLAHQFNISTDSASKLWQMMHQQYLDALAGKTGVSRQAFMDWAHAAHISTNEANNLWGMLHQQYFDTLTDKANKNRGSFQRLSAAWGVSANKADALWRVLQQQYLDQITHKATLSHQAFDTLARKLGYSKTEADAMWNSLKRMKGTYGVHVHTNVDGGGKVGAEVTVSAAIANTMKQAGNLGSNVLKALGLAQGGMLPMSHSGGSTVPGWGNHDSVPAMLMPGELVIPKNHAAAFAGMAKRKGIPGFASGGVVGSTTDPLAGAGGLLTTQTSGNVREMPKEGQQLDTIPLKLASEVAKIGPMVTSELVSSIQAVQSAIMMAGTASIPGGVVSGSAMANLSSIGRYLMTQGATPAAAAGIASVVYGESAGNPEAVGSGGYGLIGWTGNNIGLPPGYHGPTGNASRDLAVQMAGIVGYGKANGPWGSLLKMTDPIAAGNLWSSAFERPAVHLSDTRPGLATQLYASLKGYKGMGPIAPGAAGVGAGAALGSNRIVADAERYIGHPYRWGGPSNPSTGWDCSSFASWVLGHDLGMGLPGGSWSSVTNAGKSHGPTASAFTGLPGAHPVGSNPGQILPGDVLVWPGHVGFGVGPNKMFSAYGTNFGTIFSNAQAAGGLTIMRYGAGAMFGGSGSTMPGPQTDIGAFSFHFGEGGIVGDAGAGGSRGAVSKAVKNTHKSTPKPHHIPKPKKPSESQDIVAYNKMMKKVVAYYNEAIILADAAKKQAITKAPNAAQKAADIAAANKLTGQADQRKAKSARDRALLNQANKLVTEAHAFELPGSKRKSLLDLASNDLFAANNAKVKPNVKKALIHEAALLTAEANRPKHSKAQQEKLLHEAAVDRNKVSYSHTPGQRRKLLAEAAADRAATHTKTGSTARAQHLLALAQAEEMKMAALDHLAMGKLKKSIAPAQMKTLLADAQELADLNLLGADPLLRGMRAFTGVVSNPHLKNLLGAASTAVSGNSASVLAAGAPIKGLNTALGTQVDRWAPDVSKVLGMEGLSQRLLNQVLFQISTESSGNPKAINLWDSNAKAGHPSQGLLQTIPSTFKKFHWPGTSFNIDDPMANIAAAVNYADHTYGPTLMRGGKGLGSGRGYATGGIIPEPVFGVGMSGKRYSFGERGPERILPGTTPNGGGGGSPGLTVYQGNTLIQLIQQLVTINRQQPQQMGAAMQRGTAHSAMAGFTQLGR